MEGSCCENLTISTGWGNCPADLLMIIFKQMDSKTLLNCMAVNEWWRDVVDYVAQHYGYWPNMAQEAMVNEGVTFRKKSSPTNMGWRDLYVNSHLWQCVGSADLKWSRVCSTEHIKSMHVYKGFLIIMHGPQLNRKYYKIEEVMQELRAVPKSNTQDGPIARAVRNEASNFTEEKRIESGCVVKESDRMILKLIKEAPFKRFVVFDDNCYYVLDDRNVMRCFKWIESESSWQDHTLARYYGCNTSISDIHVSKGDVYMLLKSGNVMRLDREGRNFEMLFGLDLPPQTLAYFARMFYRNRPMRKLDRVIELSVPEYSTGRNVMFHELSAVVSVPAEREFKINSHKDSDHVVVECPNLTCATEHGDILLLGYKNGRIDICSTKTLSEKGYAPELSVNIQDCYLHLGENCDLVVLDEDPAIVGLEVFEFKESHYLFIATSLNIYRLTLKYSDSVKSTVSAIKC